MAVDAAVDAAAVTVDARMMVMVLILLLLILADVVDAVVRIGLWVSGKLL